MNKFKAGDKVVLVEDLNCARKGATAVVDNPPYRDGWLIIKWNGYRSHNQFDGGYYDRHFDLILEEKPKVKFMVYFHTVGEHYYDTLELAKANAGERKIYEVVAEHAVQTEINYVRKEF